MRNFERSSVRFSGASVSRFVPRRGLAAAACLVLVMGGLGGCTTPLTETYTRPAGFNMAGRNVVQLGEIRGAGGEVVRSHIEERLISGGLRVVDRGAGDQVADTEGARDDSYDRGDRADVFIEGTVTDHDFGQKHDTREVKIDGRKTRLQRTVGNASVAVSLRMTDLYESELITSKVLRSQNTGKTTYETYRQNIDPDTLFQNCYRDLATDFSKQIAPYDVTVTHQVYNKKEVPSSETGLAQLSGGETQAAIATFGRAINEAQALQKSNSKWVGEQYHNQGVAYEMAGQFEDAKRCYRKAGDLKVEKADANVLRCNDRIADQKELANQGLR